MIYSRYIRINYQLSDYTNPFLLIVNRGILLCLILPT
nr:MAG TPA: hypothetical protein [Caudoviricetes sp.]